MVGLHIRAGRCDMRRSSVVKVVALAGTLGMLALLSSAGGAQALPCLDCPGGGTTLQGQHIQAVFTSFVVVCAESCTNANGQREGIASGGHFPTDPLFPPSPCNALAEGKLFLPGSDGAFAIGRLWPSDPVRGGYLFEGHLLPASAPPPSAFPSDPMRFLGVVFPPSPCRGS
jgi:hypothetical protein